MSGEYFLAYLNPLFALSCAALIWTLQRRWPGHRYLFPLGLSFILLALGFISEDFFGYALTHAVNYSGNVLFFASVLLACSSTLVRAGVRVPVRTYAMVTVATFAAFLWFAIGQPWLEGRIYVLGVGYALIAASTLFFLLRAGPRTIADRLMSLAVGLGIVAALLRPALVFFGLLDVGTHPVFTDSDYWATIRVFTPLIALGIVTIFFFAMALDIHGELKRLAEQDYLSRLLNRRGFEIAAGDALERHAGRPAALLMADIDDFKMVNDSFGHKTGDDVIASVAKVLADEGQSLLAGRVGGEEFALFYQGADQAALRRHAEAIRTAMTQIRVPGLPAGHPLTLSIGIHVQSRGESLTEMLLEADRALYKAKAAGKNRAVMSPIKLRAVTD